MTLVHYTNDIDVLFSILKYGFIYSHNETALLDHLAGDYLIPENILPTGGMVCFTDLEFAQAEAVRSKFGKYGIVVKKDFLIDHEAREVQYLNPKSVEFNQLKKQFEGGIPNHWKKLNPKNHTREMARTDDSDDTEAMIQSVMIASGRDFRGNEVSRDWLKLLDDFRYCQTDEHSFESEWRVPNEYMLSFISKTKQSPEEYRCERIRETVRQLDNIAKNLKGYNNSGISREQLIQTARGYSLLPQPKHILYLHVPKSEQVKIKRKADRFKNLMGAPYKGIHVTGY